MNEVTKIHLGRQPFNISIAAHRELRVYLDAIEKQVDDKDVAEEVELRMAELLSEHGIKGEKVILAKDVDYLKKQLGNPKDFKENADEETVASVNLTESKRLFRDTDNAMVAGVAAGLAKYFGVDVLLIRILFVLGTIAWGGGILLYIVLWLLVPEAKSSSEKLQMQGRAVTVEGLKEVVERADVKGAANRVNKTLAEPINKIFRLIVKLIGIGFVVVGLGFMLGLLAVGFYLIFHGNFIQDNLFPVGLKEHFLVYIGFYVAGLISIFIVLVGMTIFRRKWPVRTWLTGVLAGVAFIGLAATAALAADTVPRVRDRYNANFHTVVRSLPPFTKVNAIGPGDTVNIVPSDKYYVSLRYYNGGDPTQVKTTVSNGILLIDSQQYKWDRQCPSFCFPNTYDMEVTVYTPNPPPDLYPAPAESVAVPNSKQFYDNQ